MQSNNEIFSTIKRNIDVLALVGNDGTTLKETILNDIKLFAQSQHPVQQGEIRRLKKELEEEQHKNRELFADLCQTDRKLGKAENENTFYESELNRLF